MKIGLLGGSFNPAHAGHVHISEIALKKLGLDQIWWMVSPQNPLKSTNDMQSFDKRYDEAKALVTNPKIKVTDIENRLNTRYTIDTLNKITKRYSDIEFYWLMGADNLLNFHKWNGWENILKLVPVHVFDRAEFFYAATTSKQYQKYKGRITYHRIRKYNISSTEIRKKYKN